MGGMNMFELLLPDPTRMRCDNVTHMEEDRRIFLQLTANAVDSVCPICNQKTNKVHSRYNRHLADLPWADVPVSICLEVRRFFCRNESCPRAIFCERLPGVVSPWASWLSKPLCCIPGRTIWLHTTPHLQFEADRFRLILGRTVGISNRRQLRSL